MQLMQYGVTGLLLRHNIVVMETTFHIFRLLDDALKVKAMQVVPGKKFSSQRRYTSGPLSLR
jgi:hypothetical protein